MNVNSDKMLNRILVALLGILALTLLPFAWGNTTDYTAQLPEPKDQAQKTLWNNILTQFIEKADPSTITGDIVTSGNVKFTNAGTGLSFVTNSTSARAGRSTLVAGVASNANTTITSKTRYLFTASSTNSASNPVGILQLQSAINGTNFIIESCSPTNSTHTVQTGDVRTVDWILYEVNP